METFGFFTACIIGGILFGLILTTLSSFWALPGIERELKRIADLYEKNARQD